MKGFLHRDISLFLPNLRIYGGLLALTLALSFYSDMAVSFFLLYLMLLGEVCIQTLFTFDSLNAWNSYAAAIPGGRRAMVDARYLVTLGIGALQVLTELLVNLRLGRWGLLYSGLYLLLLSALLPVAYRFGTRGAVMLTILALGIVILGAVVFLAWQDLMLGRDMSGALGLLSYGLPLGGAVLLALSWPLSKTIMTKKEC